MEVWVGWVNPKTLALDERTGRSPDTVFTEKGGPSHAKNTVWYSEGHREVGGGEDPKHHHP